MNIKKVLKVNKKLLFVDIDGTLTLPGENIPPKSALKAIKQAQENGHKVFLCTGRNFGMLKPLLKYGFDGVIGCGGGLIQIGDKLIYDYPMTNQQRDLIMEVLKRNGVFRTIESKDITYGDENLGEMLKGVGKGNSEIERWRKALSNDLGIRPMHEYDGRPIYKVVVMCERSEQLNEARELLEKDFVFAIQDVAAHNCLNGDIINRAFDKGQAIQRVCKYLNISILDTIGFGDSMNDLEMIRTVGISVCMENGSPKLKEISDVIAPGVEEEGLYKVFQKLKLIEGEEGNGIKLS